MLLTRFEVKLAPGKRNETAMINETQDNFTAKMGELILIFKRMDDTAD
jgi:hypothetical protein